MNQEAPISEAEACQFVIDLVYEGVGIRLNQGKEALIRARLGKRMRQHGFASLGEYCRMLRAPGQEEERRLVFESLTTNFTSFLREEEHFELLTQVALPSVLGKARRRFSVWSAACSSGEEPYSIGFYLSEYFAPEDGWHWHIQATDISTRMLQVAQDAIYSEEKVEVVPRGWLTKYFQRGTGKWQGYYRVKAALTQRIEFQQLNLVGDYPFNGQFDVIFCRNVMIYFDRPTQEALVRRLCQFLVPGGFLFIGHSESLNGLNLPVKCLKPSFYQKVCP